MGKLVFDKVRPDTEHFVKNGPGRRPEAVPGMVGEAGIEPTTPGLEGRCSIQLSYSPAVAALRSASLIVIGAAARKIASQASRAARVSAPQPAA
jgi:hypothetical protein